MQIKNHLIKGSLIFLIVMTISVPLVSSAKEIFLNLLVITIQNQDRNQTKMTCRAHLHPHTKKAVINLVSNIEFGLMAHLYGDEYKGESQYLPQGQLIDTNKIIIECWESGTYKMHARKRGVKKQWVTLYWFDGKLHETPRAPAGHEAWLP